MSDPMMAISYFQLAHLLFMSKRFSEAETEYENALKVLSSENLHYSFIRIIVYARKFDDGLCPNGARLLPL